MVKVETEYKIKSKIAKNIAGMSEHEHGSVVVKRKKVNIDVKKPKLAVNYKVSR